MLCGYLAYVASIGRARRGRAPRGVGACAAVVGTVAYSRMYLDAHFLSDILGGFTAGLALSLRRDLGDRLRAAARAGPELWPLGRGADALLVPATAVLSVDPLVAPAPVVAMTPATPAVDAS